MSHSLHCVQYQPPFLAAPPHSRSRLRFFFFFFFCMNRASVQSIFIASAHCFFFSTSMYHSVFPLLNTARFSTGSRFQVGLQQSRPYCGISFDSHDKRRQLQFFSIFPLVHFIGFPPSIRFRPTFPIAHSLSFFPARIFSPELGRRYSVHSWQERPTNKLGQYVDFHILSTGDVYVIPY